MKKKADISLEIRDRLFELQDNDYALLQAKITPGIEKEVIIGVRTPELRKLAKEYAKHKDVKEFILDYPHKYYDEQNMHGFIICECKDYEEMVRLLDDFLPGVDNWATCDLLSPKVFKKNRDRLKADIEKWFSSKHLYTKRFAIRMVMNHYLDEDFDEDWLYKIAAVRSDEYYMNMMVAWFFATALAKQWDKAIPFVEKNYMDKWTHNKTIQKAVESFRITQEQKDYLKTLRVK